VVVECDHAQRTRRRLAQTRGGVHELHLPEAAALLAPRAYGVQTHHDQPLRGVRGLDRSEDALPLGERAGKASWDGVRDVVISGYGQHGDPEAPKELRCSLEFRTPPAVREIARGEHELGGELRGELAQRGNGLGRLALADVEIRDVENARGHRRGRLYTRIVANEAPELFDDIYLGLRAGGAVRKQRRGEPLSAEEKEAIGHWRRLSLWRKFIAVGAFALGTFGLGFTIGGLIFGRGRKARA